MSTEDDLRRAEHKLAQIAAIVGPQECSYELDRYRFSDAQRWNLKSDEVARRWGTQNPGPLVSELIAGTSYSQCPHCTAAGLTRELLPDCIRKVDGEFVAPKPEDLREFVTCSRCHHYELFPISGDDPRWKDHPIWKLTFGSQHPILDGRERFE